MTDVLVVGAGSSGATLAAGLVDRGAQVTLLEAGPDYRSSDVPDALRSANCWRPIADPAYDGYLWQGLTARRTPKQDPLPYWRGRGVGGSSAINGQIAIRAMLEDFASWRAAGEVGLWTDEHVLRHYVGLETDLQYGGDDGHGGSGPIPVDRNPLGEWGPADRLLRDVALRAGHPWCEDVNAPSGTGISPYPINSRNGRRVTVNDAYLEPRRNHPGLRIEGGAEVRRVLFAGNRAIGVDVVQDGSTTRRLADEVVLSAGAVHSPAILMRSGIGPHGRRVELPVGENLLEHPLTGIELAWRPDVAMTDPDARHTNCCVRHTSRHPGTGVNDMMLVALNHQALEPVGMLGLWLNQSFSTGRITLDEPHPVLDVNALSDPRDLVRLREGVRTLWADLDRVDWTEYATSRALLGGGDPESMSDAELDDHLLRTVTDAQHICGTAKMAGDETAVVDEQCQVLGTTHLRVVDASVFPTMPRANLHLTAVMLGSRMAQWIGDGA